MKILITSDIHGDEDALNHMISLKDKCETVFVAGDIQGPSPSDIYRVFDKLSDIGEPVYITPGNHDFWAYNVVSNYRHHDLKNITVVVDGLITLPNDMKVWFSPWSTPFGGWNWMRPEEHGYFVPDCDAVVTHGPCYGLNDTCPNGDHAGSQALLKAVNSVRDCAYVFSGHIHYNDFPHVSNDYREYYGVAALNEHYVFKGKLPIFDTETGEMEYV